MKSLREGVTAGHSRGSLLPVQGSVLLPESFQIPLQGMGRKGRSTVRWRKINQYKDADFTMLKDAIMSTLITKGSTQEKAGKEKASVPTWARALLNTILTMTVDVQKRTWKRSYCKREIRVRREIFLTYSLLVLRTLIFRFPQGKWLQIKSFPSHEGEHACALQHWSQNKAWPCPGYPANIMWLQLFKPIPPCRAVPISKAPCPPRGDQSLTSLYALPLPL